MPFVFYSGLDWFLPPILRDKGEVHRRARIFIVGHFLGPLLGLLLSVCLYRLDPAPGLAFWTIVALLGGFYLYPLALRITGWFNFLAFMSVQQQASVVLLAAFNYGGASSPFLPWLLSTPLSAYFYFSSRTQLRTLVLVLIALDLLVFYLAYAMGVDFPQRVPLKAMSDVGLFSVFCAAVYVSLLSSNYANIVTAQQSDLEREVAIRRAAESALRDEKEKAEDLGESFRLLFAGNPLPLWVYDIDTRRFLEVNEVALAQYGYSREQFLALTVDKIGASGEVPVISWPQVVERLSPFHSLGIRRHRKANGDEILVDMYWHEIRFQGRRAALVGAVDVTDPKRIEDALRESEARLRQILDTAYDAFISFDAEGRITAWNAEAERIFGWSAEEALGRNVIDTILSEQLRATYRNGIMRYRQTGEAKLVGQRLELGATRRDGSEFPVEMTISPMRGKDGLAFNTFIHDITERREREKAVRDSEARYRLLAVNATDVISRVALDGTRLYVSPAVRDILGYEPQELIGRRITEIPDSEDAAVARAAITALRRGDESVTVTFRGRRKDGGLVWLESSLRIVRDAASGKPSELVIVSRDVSARRALQEQLGAAKEEAERANRAKSEFLANMSHELRTPLNAIMGFGELIAQQRLGSIGNARYAEYGQDIVESGRHLLGLIQEILDFAKVDAGRLSLIEENVNIRGVIDACTHMLMDRAAQAELAIETRIAPEVGMVRADERRLKQILLNLMTNSIKFTPPGGRVIVGAHLDRGGCLVIEVGDTGIGIAEKDIAKALEPFGQIDTAFNRRVEGTGLGLPLAKRLVEMHGGTLRLESRPGSGTTTTVWLPAERVLEPTA